MCFIFQTKEPGKALLKTIASKRAESEAGPTRMSESNASNTDMVFSPNQM